jgi:hypothetical protein
MSYRQIMYVMLVYLPPHRSNSWHIRININYYTQYEMRPEKVVISLCMLKSWNVSKV